MLTMPRVKEKDEELRELIEKFEHYTRELEYCKEQTVRCPHNIDLYTTYEELIDHYGNQAQICLFKIELMKIYLQQEVS